MLLQSGAIGLYVSSIIINQVWDRWPKQLIYLFFVLFFVKFGLSFWQQCFSERRYPVSVERLDLDTLVRTRVLPSDSAREAYLLYKDDFVEVAALVFDRLPSRSFCARVMKYANFMRTPNYHSSNPSR
ncbi:MAG: hypothetical protein QW279_05025 [Candidatus Jordarchaeaceae archaeon]